MSRHALPLLLLTTLALAACATRQPSPTPPAAEAPECVFPDAPRDKAPAWVCDAPVPGVAVGAVGSHEKSAAGYAFTKEQATTAGRVILAQRVQVRVGNLVKQYVETTGSASRETVDRVNSSVTRQITQETLRGTQAVRSIVSPRGMVYVLVAQDEAGVRASAEAAVRSSLRDDAAAWQQVHGRRAHDELASEIARQPLRD